MAAFMVFASATLLMTLVFQVLDFWSFHRILTANEKKRKEIEKARAANLQQVRGRRQRAPVTLCLALTASHPPIPDVTTAHSWLTRRCCAPSLYRATSQSACLSC